MIGSTELRPSHYPGYRFETAYGTIWKNGMRTEMRTYGGPTSATFAVNDRGQVLGAADTPPPDVGKSLGFFVKHPFLWDNGKMTDLSLLPGYKIVSVSSFAPDGRMLICAVPAGANERHVYLYDGRTMADLGKLPKQDMTIRAINRRNQVVGSLTIGYRHYRDGTRFSVEHACLWQNGKVQDLGTLGGAQSEAEAINDKGQVVGQAWLKGDVFHAFLWDHGKMQDLEISSGGPYGQAKSINNKGQIIGFAYPPEGGGLKAFLWEDGQMKDLNKMIPEGSDWFDLGGATAINENGQIIGEGGKIGDAYIHTYLLTPIK